jgi:hypothetical protein
MLGLPETSALDACPRVERIDDAPSVDILRDSWCGNEEAAHRCRRLSLARGYIAEEQPEAWPGGAKLRRWRHREVELQRVGEQEHAVDGRAAFEVGKAYCAGLVAERARPVTEDVGYWHMIGDGKGEVQVGVAVAAAQRERADDGSSDDALVLLRELEHAITERIPLLNGEHGTRSFRCRAEDYAI